MISLNLGGNTDSIFALSVSLGRFFFVIFTGYERQDTETRRYTYMRKISGNKLLVKKRVWIHYLDIREPVLLISVMNYISRITRK